MNLRSIAVDDEPLALDIIKKYCSKIPFLELEAMFDNGMEALNHIKTNPTDLMFLDIQMEELTGIQLMKILDPRPYVIFTTAYDEYALEGYDLNVTDYLVKPIAFERFLKAVNKVYNKKNKNVRNEPDPIIKENNGEANSYIFMKTEYKYEKIQFDDILYIEGMGDYLRIVTKQKKIMVLQNFRTIEEVLPSGNFIRIHKSYIIAIDKIEKIERNRIFVSDKTIPVSSTYKKSFYSFLENKGIL